ncbi:MAG: hypothetical protein EHM41_16030 [Chloroflexi bacterium]|nr:MAG: hypothetical protein EHM41_16030 [Chloroflexota bacterium]
MVRKLILLSIISLTLAATRSLFIGETRQAFAQDEDPSGDTSCIGCHEDQYYLYDNGKWYCLCKSPVSCTGCHSGRPDNMIKDLAHESLIANPLLNDAAVCQNCHPEDYQDKVEKFTSIAGTHSHPVPYATCTPAAPISYTKNDTGSTKLLRSLPSGIWQAAGISFLGIASLIVFLFTCKCWKIDHSSGIKG